MQKNQKQQIVKSLGIGHLAPTRQDKIVDVIMEGVAAKVNLAIWDAFVQEDKIKLANMGGAGNKKMVDYVTSQMENFPRLVEEITAQTIKDFKRRRSISR